MSSSQGGLRSPKKPGNIYNALQEDIEAGVVVQTQDETEVDDEKGGSSWKNYDKIQKAEEEAEINLQIKDEVDPSSDKPYFDHAAVLSSIDAGCWFKTITGTAGNVPSEDVFPWFANSAEIYIRLLWDLLPSDWRIVSFPKIPRNAYDPEEYLKASQILVKDITDVMLELSPSTSFRVYLGETRQVVKFTPLPQQRETASAWVDAIYSAMQLQVDEEEVRGALEDQEQDQEPGEALQDLLDLREHFYEVYPDLRPPDFEEIEAGGSHNSNALTIYNNNNNNNGQSLTLGAEEEEDLENPRRNSLRNNRTSDNRASKRLSFGRIYDNQKKEKPVLDRSNDHCCFLS